MNIRRPPLALLVAVSFASTPALSQTSPPPSTPASQAPATSSPSQADRSDALLPPGTAIPAELSKSIDAKVTMDLLAHGQIVVPRDSKLTGHVTEAKPRSKQSPESSVGIAFDHIS